MNVLTLLIPALFFYVLAHRFYAPFLAKIFGEDDSRVTPAVAKNDGVDFVPTKPHILFAHHFSAIAAAGPILGPTMALTYGYLPAFLWIVVGAIAIGAVHDYGCLFVSIREGGRSIAEIARKLLGTPAFILFALFIVFNLVVVNAVFINLTAVSLTSLRSPEDLGLSLDQTIFRTIITPEGKTMAVVGGIGSTSAIVLTVIAPLLGWLLIKRNLRNRYAYPIATILCIVSVLIGFAWPIIPPAIDIPTGFLMESQYLHIEPVNFWVILISIYVFLAAAFPVWLILQPREFVSVQFLYLGIGILVMAVIGAGLKGVPIQAPAANLMQGEMALGYLWPSLFVTIACGAISGFHGLVSSGTTSKQIMKESQARHVGYLAMLGESALALCVTLAIAAGIGYSEYTSFLIKPEGSPITWKQNPVLAFSVGVAGICNLGLGIPKWLGLVFGLLMVEGFVLDTLDVSIRLNRYLLEEIWNVIFKKVPKFLRSFWVNSGISVALMLALAYSNTAQTLWPIFGSGNQLLASLSLFTLSVWLLVHNRRALYVAIPAVLVGVTTLASLIYLLFWKYLPSKNYLLAATDIIFLALAAGVFLTGLRAIRKHKAATATS